MLSNKAKSKNKTNPPELAGQPVWVARLVIHLAEPRRHIQKVRI